MSQLLYFIPIVGPITYIYQTREYQKKLDLLQNPKLENDLTKIKILKELKKIDVKLHAGAGFQIIVEIALLIFKRLSPLLCLGFFFVSLIQAHIAHKNIKKRELILKDVEKNCLHVFFDRVNQSLNKGEKEGDEIHNLLSADFLKYSTKKRESLVHTWITKAEIFSKCSEDLLDIERQESIIKDGMVYKTNETKLIFTICANILTAALVRLKSDEGKHPKTMTLESHVKSMQDTIQLPFFKKILYLIKELNCLDKSTFGAIQELALRNISLFWTQENTEAYNAYMTKLEEKNRKNKNL